MFCLLLFSLFTESTKIPKGEPRPQQDCLRESPRDSKNEKLHSCTTSSCMGSPPRRWCLSHSRNLQDRKPDPEHWRFICETHYWWDGWAWSHCQTGCSERGTTLEHNGYLQELWNSTIVFLESSITIFGLHKFIICLVTGFENACDGSAAKFYVPLVYAGSIILWTRKILDPSNLLIINFL